MKRTLTGAAAIMMAGAASPALAQNWGGPIEIGRGVSLDPVIDMRLRYEHVEQDNAEDNAAALTLRLRTGGEIKADGFSMLVEGEGVAALADSYNAFPFAAESQNRAYLVVPDPENIELNRAQIGWAGKGGGVTLGRQRINLDDQRWVGSVGWRQNEQTFDALRGTAKLGAFTFNATYAIGQRTIFGRDAGARQNYDGTFLFLGAGVQTEGLQIKGFAYLLDYDDPLMAAASSKTFGVLATGTIPLSPLAKFGFKASYARQSDWKTTARNYAADYAALEGTLAVKGLAVTGGYELLGSDRGVGVSTPMATLHKFNGWADVFLNTPSGGLQDIYGGIAYSFPAVSGVKGVSAAIAWHQFDSARGALNYGSEWDASFGFKVGSVGILAKYARYDAEDFGTDTEKFWLQAEYAF